MQQTGQRTRSVGVSDLDGIIRRQVLKVVVAVALDTLAEVRDHNHWRIDTAAHALHLTDCEHAVWRGLAHVNAEMVF